MSIPGSAEAAAAGARLSIGALSRATGIPVETLRTWEARYGFPVPDRKPSGHRLYPLSAVARLRRIAEALTLGHRAGQVVSASDAELDQLLRATTTPGGGAPVSLGSATVAQLLDRVEHFDAERLTAALLADWSRTSPLDFLENLVAPLVHAVGEAWAEGRLHVRHEHFLSERVGDLLRSVRLPFEDRARGPVVVMATLPGEEHALGLHMAALLMSWAGCRVLFLGTQVPVPELAAIARESQARVVALSISLATRGARSASLLRTLRARLSPKASLLLGGAGAPEPRPGIEVVHGLRELDSWARALHD